MEKLNFLEQHIVEKPFVDPDSETGLSRVDLGVSAFFNQAITVNLNVEETIDHIMEESIVKVGGDEEKGLKRLLGQIKSFKGKLDQDIRTAAKLPEEQAVSLLRQIVRAPELAALNDDQFTSCMRKATMQREIIIRERRKTKGWKKSWARRLNCAPEEIATPPGWVLTEDELEGESADTLDIALDTVRRGWL